MSALQLLKGDRSDPSTSIVNRIGVNEFNGAQSLQLVIEHWEAA